jgi:hypothetical protein
MFGIGASMKYGHCSKITVLPRVCPFLTVRLSQFGVSNPCIIVEDFFEILTRPYILLE